MYVFVFYCLLWMPPPPRSTLFPYTALFRSYEVTFDKMCCHARAMSAWSRCGQPKLWHTPFFHSMVCARASVGRTATRPDRKSTRLNSSHVEISYAVFCLKKKKINNTNNLH